MRASLLLALVLSLLGLVAPRAHAGINGPPPPEPAAASLLHVEGIALWTVDDDGAALLLVEDLRLLEPLLVAGRPAIRETHVRLLAVVYGQHAPGTLPLAADPVQGCAVWEYERAEGGRFVQRDPAKQDACYKYAGNRPTGATDPTGQDIVITGGDEAVKAFKEQLWAYQIEGFPGKGSGNFVKFSSANSPPTVPKEYNREAEILWRMMISKRQFTFTDTQDLAANMVVREAFVEAAQSVKWKFQPFYQTSDLPLWWEAIGEKDAFFDARGDISGGISEWFTPRATRYRSGCYYGTVLAFWRARQLCGTGLTGTGGWKLSELAVRADSQVNTTNTDDDTDWVPGDWGYIHNRADTKEHPAPQGLEGENIVYMGGSYALGEDFKKEPRFWGILGGEPVRPLLEWEALVKGWSHGAGFDLRTKRVSP